MRTMGTGSRICKSLVGLSRLDAYGRYALNSHFGTEEDLQALADALHARGMYLMVDVVTNHMVCLFTQGMG